MKFYFLLSLFLIQMRLSAQLTFHSRELPVMTRSALHDVLLNSDGEKLYYFTSRTCSTTKFYLEDQTGVNEISTTEPILVIASVVDSLDNVWILSGFEGLQIIKMDFQGVVLESWGLPIYFSSSSHDPKLIWSDQLELLLDGRIYHLDPFNQHIESIESPVAFTDIIYHKKDRHLIAYNDTALYFIDEFDQIFFEVEFPSIQHVFIGPNGELYQVGRWSIQAVSPDEGVRRLVNFSEPLSNGMVCKVGERFLLFESPSSIFWESFRTIDIYHGKLGEPVSLTDLGYLLTYPVLSCSAVDLYLLGYDQYAYRLLTVGDNLEDERFSDIKIHHAAAQIEDWYFDRDDFKVEVKITLELENFEDFPIDYFTVVCSRDEVSCHGLYYFTDSIQDFNAHSHEIYTYNLSMNFEDFDLNKDSIYLGELRIMAINGLADKDRSDNHIRAYAHFAPTTNAIDVSIPFEVVIYPNPCRDVLYVKSDKLSPFPMLNLYDCKGRKVKTLKSQNGSNSVSSLPSGSYYLLGESDDGRRSKPALIIKE